MSDPISDEPLDARVEESEKRKSAVMTPFDACVLCGMTRGWAWEASMGFFCETSPNLMHVFKASMRSRVLSAPSTEGPQAEQEKR